MKIEVKHDGDYLTVDETTQAQEETKTNFGATNTFFTQDVADKALELLSKKRNQLNAGFDPEIMMAGIQYSGYLIEGGIRSFAAYSKKMIDALGEEFVKPYLRFWYKGVRDFPGFDNTGMQSDVEIDLEAAGGQPAAVTTPLQDKIKEEEAKADPAPSQAQAEAGNYAKGHFAWNGLNVTIETPKGAIRKGDGWEVTMPVSYGYVRGTQGGDGEQLDVFMGPNPDHGYVWLVKQRKANPNWKQGDREIRDFDEWKLLAGFNRGDEALEAYFASFQNDYGRKVFGELTPSLSIEHLKERLPSLYKNTSIKGGPSPAPKAGEPAPPASEFMEIVQTKHTKTGEPLWVVRMTNRLPTDTYKSLEARAKTMGGYYSSYSRGGAVPGFTFKSQAEAERFMGRKDGPVAADDTKDARARAVGAFRDAFLTGRSFATITEARSFFAEKAGMSRVEAGTPIAKVVDEAIEEAVVMAAREIVRTGPARGQTIKQTYQRLVQLYGQQPRLGVRTSTSIEQQAYSTPVPLAYLTSRLAGINDATRAYEPTAGNGMLLIGANPSRTVANELNAERRTALRRLGFEEVTGHDATIFAPDGKVDVVIANPPFGVVKEGGENKRFTVKTGAFDSGSYETGEVDHAIAMKALGAMKDDGRAVLILGGLNPQIKDLDAQAEAYNSAAKRKFYFSLYNDYNVTDHFTVEGDLYERQGAGWPVDVIVINGRGKSARTLPAADLPKRYESWDALGRKLDESMVPESSVTQPGEPAAGGVGTGAGLSAGDGQGAVPGAASRPGDSDGQGNPKPDTASAGGPAVGGTTPGASTKRPGSDGLESADQRGGDQNGAVRGGDNASGARAGGRGQGGAGGVLSDRPRDVGGSIDIAGRDIAAGVTQLPYRPQSNSYKLGTLIPTNLATATDQALTNLRNKVGPLDDFVAKKLGFAVHGKYLQLDPNGKIEWNQASLFEPLGAEQVDAIALAIDAADKGGGFIIGDQTGVGKGRVVAAMIRYAMRQGRTPIFVTEKPMLYGDIYRDLKALGMGNIRMLMTNAGETIPLTDDPDGPSLKTPDAPTHNAALMKIAEKGRLTDHDLIVTTYNQMQDIESGSTPRQAFLSAFAKDGFLLFDESHNAGGSDATNRNGQVTGKTGRAAFSRGLVQSSYTTFYSSATYAKRPSVMDLYARTDMRLAVEGTKESLASLMEAGGVPMQQAAASMLTEAGQYIRRERSFDGINYNTVDVAVDVKVADKISGFLSTINDWDRGPKAAAIRALNAGARSAGEKAGDAGAAGVHSTHFTSTMHNLINQMLLSIKTKATVDLAAKRVAEGEKVVIAVSNTMGSFIEQFAEEHDLQSGDSVDLSFANLLDRYLERQRWYIRTSPDGKQSRHRLSDADLGQTGTAMFDGIRESILGSAPQLADLPVSPIDYIHAKLKAAGVRSGEITGRSATLDYSQSDAAPVYRLRPSKETTQKAKRAIITAFNAGDTDVVVLNQSGSTGISLHASNTFRDQRKRRMMILQAEGNVDTHMQILGRINRTGQVVLPEYDQIAANIPAEKRPAAVISAKMAKLSASTTATRGSALSSTETVDFMNQYGDDIAEQMMADNPDLHKRLGSPLGLLDGDGKFSVKDGHMRAVTGRLALLPVKDQADIYDLLESEYKDTIARLDAMGENALEAKTLPYEARTIASTEIFESKGPSPFQRAANLELVSLKRLGKPYTEEQMVAEARKHLESTGKGLTQISRDGEKRATDQVEKFWNEYAGWERAELLDIENATAKSVFQTKARARASRLAQVLRVAHVGAPVEVLGTGSAFNGIVLRVERKAGQGASPVALGLWRITIAMPDAAKVLTIPVSQLQTKEQGDGTARSIIDRADMTETLDGFAHAASQSRENRYVVTGNIVAGYAKVGGGTITQFTDDKGRIVTGVMKHRGWKPTKMLAVDRTVLPDANKLYDFLIGRKLARAISSDGTIGVRTKGALFDIGIRRGDKAIYMDKAIIEAIGQDFVLNGQRMTARIDHAAMSRLMRELKSRSIEFEAANEFDWARAVAGVKGDPRRVAAEKMERIEREQAAKDRAGKGDISADLTLPVDMAGAPRATSSRETTKALDSLRRHIERMAEVSIPRGAYVPAAVSDLIQRIGAIWGGNIHGFRVAQGMPRGTPAPNGARADDGIFLNADAKRPHMAVLGHELVH
ncbi:MAG: strawberry notch C-terminal domain-containing protein, partial [Aestuariivirga sp.]